MRERFGFSLIELSIVLVILGLLTGGILAGQSLIRAAELRSISTDISRYSTAVYTFRDKYFAFPGDMTNATSFWGAADGSTGITTACRTTIGTGTATCNGNGNGRVESLTYNAEFFRAWQQLANAGLVEGSFTGVPNTGGANLAIPGENVPRGRISQSGISFWYTAALTVETGSWWITPGGNLFSIGNAWTDSETRIPFLKPEEAWNVDTKLDDGKVAQGWINGTRPQSAPSATSGCGTTQLTSTAEYNLVNSAIDCAMRAFLR